MPKMASTGLVGRDREVRQLEKLVGQVVAGRGGAVLVEGEPGIGKSALLAAGLKDARERGCEVYWAVADELGQLFPLRVITECLEIERRRHDPARAEIAAMLGLAPSANAAGSANPLLAVTERLLALVDRLCAAAPVVMVIDDLQWADEASVLAWHRLAHTLRQLPLLLVAAVRPVPKRVEIEQLRRGLAARGCQFISLEPLALPQAAELVGHLVGARPGPALAKLAEHASGNPLYLRELVDFLVRNDAVRIAGGTAEAVGGLPEEPAAATTLSTVIAARLKFLSPVTADALRLAAILGTEFTVTDLATVAKRPPTDLVPVVDEAITAGVLVDAGQRLRFRHPLIWQALYGSLAVALRSALHRETAELLAEAGAPAVQVAEQLLPSLPTIDRWVVGWLAKAGPALIYQAPRIAADLLRQAVQNAPAGDADADLLALMLVRVLFRIGAYAELEQVGRPALASVHDPEAAAEIRWLLVYGLIRSGPKDQGVAIAVGALEEAALMGRWAARQQALLSLAETGLGRLKEARANAAQALVTGEAAGDSFAVAYALHALSLVAAYQGQNVAVVELVDRALAIAGEAAEHADLCVIMLNNRMLAYQNLGQTAEAETDLRAARRLAERMGSPRAALMSMVAAERYFVSGQWDDALTDLESVSEVADVAELGEHRLFVDGIVALVAAHRDDRPTVEACLSAVADRPADTVADRSNATYLLMARSLAAEQDGNPQAALAVLRPTLDPDYAVGMHQRYAWLPDIVRLALSTGEVATAREATEVCEALADQESSLVKTAAATRCRGLLEQSPDVLAEAADFYRTVAQPLELAYTLEDLAVLHAERGDVKAARSAFTEAIELYFGLAADWDMRRADARVRPYGVRRGRRTTRQRPSFGWESLTPTELKVAELVAQGLSNPDIAARLFLSRRTVQVHVSHILAKLSARSRSEVAHEAASRITALPDSS
jgi:DNA-binding CsgD family transcriptional regulator